MSGLPKESSSYRELYNILNGALEARILLAGIELKVFDHLSLPVSADELARDMNWDPINTARFLDALATLSLVGKQEGLYWNHHLARTFLTGNSPTYIGDMFLMYHRMSVEGLAQMPDLIRNGPDESGSLEKFASEELWAEAAKAMSQWVFGQVGQTLASIVSELPGFLGFEKVLDLGGGHGVFAMYMVEAHPSLEGVVFDRRPVLETARQLAVRFGLADRMRTQAGDYLEDSLGEDYDLVFASSTLNFAKGRIDELMAKIYRALKPGGYFLSFQEGMTHERTRPGIMLPHLAESLKSREDFIFDQGFLAEAMLRVGFKHVRSRTIAIPMGALDLDVAKK